MWLRYTGRCRALRLGVLMRCLDGDWRRTLQALMLLFSSYRPVLALCAGVFVVGMVNPWVDCGQDLQCAERVAGFAFPIKLSNYSVRAMHQMIEVIFSLDKSRTAIIRKSQICDSKTDLSEDYHHYEFRGVLIAPSGTHLQIRGDGNKIYVATFAVGASCYACSCQDGMTVDELYGLSGLVQ